MGFFSFIFYVFLFLGTFYCTPLLHASRFVSIGRLEIVILFDFNEYCFRISRSFSKRCLHRNCMVMEERSIRYSLWGLLEWESLHWSIPCAQYAVATMMRSWHLRQFKPQGHSAQPRRYICVPIPWNEKLHQYYHVKYSNIISANQDMLWNIIYDQNLYELVQYLTSLCKQLLINCFFQNKPLCTVSKKDNL